MITIPTTCEETAVNTKSASWLGKKWGLHLPDKHTTNPTVFFFCVG